MPIAEDIVFTSCEIRFRGDNVYTITDLYNYLREVDREAFLGPAPIVAGSEVNPGQITLLSPWTLNSNTVRHLTEGSIIEEETGAVYMSTQPLGMIQFPRIRGARVTTRPLGKKRLPKTTKEWYRV